MAFFSVVKWDGDPNLFAWKYPDEELGTWTQLIVNESQQAILFKGGQALDVFEAGRHSLTTNNIPILESIINIPFGGESPFKVEVWFVNKAFNLDVKWGTPSPIQIKDPVYGVFVPVRSNGIFGIQIDDAKRFLIKLVGTLPSFSKQDILKYFRGLYVTQAKDAISTYILENEIGILEINMYLEEISEYLKERITPVMEDYGIRLCNFYVNSISVPEDDPAVIQLRDSLAKKAQMDIVGFNYVQERSFDTLQSAASNPGSTAAPIMGAGLGMGMGFGMGAGIGNGFTQVASNMNPYYMPHAGSVPSTPIQGYYDAAPGQANAGQANAYEAICPRCGMPIYPGQKFCGFCGQTYQPLQNNSTGTAPAKFCSSCGNPLRPGSRFCTRCGEPIDDLPPSIPPHQQQASRHLNDQQQPQDTASSPLATHDEKHANKSTEDKEPGEHGE